jgi:hypothetical protein
MEVRTFTDWLSARAKQASAKLQSLPSESWGGHEFVSLAAEQFEIGAAMNLLARYSYEKLELEGLPNFAFESQLRDILECLNQELVGRSSDLKCDTYSTYRVDTARRMVDALVDAVVVKP